MLKWSTIGDYLNAMLCKRLLKILVILTKTLKVRYISVGNMGALYLSLSSLSCSINKCKLIDHCAEFNII